MSDLRQAAQQALEALEWHLDRGTWGADLGGCAAALRDALEQQAERAQEPVAWYYERDTEKGLSFAPDRDPCKCWQPLYTTPPQRPPLTDAEIDRLWRDPQQGYWDYRKFARAIERKVRGE